MLSNALSSGPMYTYDEHAVFPEGVDSAASEIAPCNQENSRELYYDSKGIGSCPSFTEKYTYDRHQILSSRACQSWTAAEDKTRERCAHRHL